MGLLFEAIEAEEAEVRGRVEQLEARLAEVTELLEAEREKLTRLEITRETAGALWGRIRRQRRGRAGGRDAADGGAGSCVPVRNLKAIASITCR
jgi:hypothetical protein